MRANLCISLATVWAFTCATLPALGAGAIVNGNANLNLAGRANGYSCCSGDSAPAQSPTLVSGLSLIAGDALTFSVSGEVSYSGAASGRNNPDGSPYPGVPRNFGDGISSPTNLNRVDALVGLFLGAGSPTGTPTPTQINYSGGLNFPSTAPQLGQVFFIGNGRSGDTRVGDFGGAVQTFIVPAGATRLYLGTTDGSGWYNNNGSFSVEVTSSSSPQVDLEMVAAQIALEIAKRSVSAGIDEIKQKLVAEFIVDLAKGLPPEVAKRLTLNPRGVVGWAAKITNNELARIFHEQ